LAYLIQSGFVRADAGDTLLNEAPGLAEGGV
jgi:hypothetical protein